MGAVRPPDVTRPGLEPGQKRQRSSKLKGQVRERPIRDPPFGAGIGSMTLGGAPYRPQTRCLVLSWRLAMTRTIPPVVDVLLGLSEVRSM